MFVLLVALSTYARSLSNNHGKPSMLFLASTMCLLKHRSLKLRMIYRCFRLDYKWTSQLFPVLVRSYIVFRSSLGAHGGFECVLSKSGTLISQQPRHPKHKASFRYHESLRQNRSRPRQLLAIPQYRSQAHRKWYASRPPSQTHHKEKHQPLSLTFPLLSGTNKPPKAS